MVEKKYKIGEGRLASFSLEQVKAKALHWADSFENLAYLDSNAYAEDRYGTYDCLLAVDSRMELVTTSDSFEALKNFHDTQQDWLFGFLSYDLKNETENLVSENHDGLGLPLLHFFVPRYLLIFKDNQLIIHAPAEEQELIFDQILSAQEQRIPFTFLSPELKERISKTDYLKTVSAIREHILEGDFYEMNFCQEFYAEDCLIDPLEVFQRLNEIAKAPFSVFYKWFGQYLLCGSPERFLKKEGNTLISQPIKGTVKRGKNESEDAVLRKQLANSKKDQAENVMIVDLVRNDLSKSCEAGTVQVEELFGIYGFEQVYQMISTIKGELREDIHFIDAIKNAYPMGSMTGAPKVKSMELIEHYEQSRRGLYSGTVGYISPDGDFDFNVVIRSLLYNSERQYLSFSVGGAIVYDSEPELEWEECQLKSKSMRAVLREPLWA